MTAWVIGKAVLLPRKTPHSNHHTLQLIHACQSHFIHIHKTVISDYNSFQALEGTETQLCHTLLIASICCHCDLSHILVHGVPFQFTVNHHILYILFQHEVSQRILFSSFNIPSTKQIHSTLHPSIRPLTLLLCNASIHVNLISHSMSHVLPLRFIIRVTTHVHGPTIPHTHILLHVIHVILDHCTLTLKLLKDLKQLIILPHSMN